MLNNFLKKSLVFIAILIIASGLIYKFYALDLWGIIFSLFSAAIIYWFLFKKYLPNEEEAKFNKPKIIDYLYLLSYLMLFALAVYALMMSGTDHSIVSPWQATPKTFFIIYFGCSACLLITLYRQNIFSQFIFSLHCFLSFSVALMIYRIGYGYDQFIHQATLELIDKIGSVAPKPLYYLGQYGLIETIHKITFVPIAYLNKFIVPVLAALYFPIFLRSKTNNYLAAALLLLFTFSPFILSTPQNFSFFFLLLIIFNSLGSKKLDLRTNLLFALASMIIHPLSGLPALIFVLYEYLHSKPIGGKQWWRWPFLLLSLLLLPALFYITEMNFSGFDMSSILYKFKLSYLPFTDLIWPYKENFLYNFAYAYGSNLGFIFFVLGLIGAAINFKAKKISRTYLHLFFVFYLSSLITRILPFNYLIEYERDDFSSRIAYLSCLFLLPYILLLFDQICARIRNTDNFRLIAFLIFSSLLMTVSIYMSYPRYDRYFNSHGYSTGDKDIEAVKKIQDDYGGDYIVLANQQVSAAALYLYGFNNYHNNIFYYPIPTSGPLYGYYLDMVYKEPSRETMSQAMKLAGVDKGYFVLNKYWWAYDKIAAEAKLTADSWVSIGEDDILIFSYQNN